MKSVCILLITLFAFIFSNAQCPTGGDIYFLTQEDIDNFSVNYPNCTEAFALVIRGENITNLNGFSQIIKMNGVLTIGGVQYGTSLINLNGLNNITEIGGLFITDNLLLTSLTGLENLTLIGGSLSFGNNVSGDQSNPMLSDISALQNVTAIGGDFILYNHDLIENLDALSSVQSIDGNIYIVENENLVSISGLNGVTSIPGYYEIRSNNSLTGISSLDEIGEHVFITHNPSLQTFEGLNNVHTLTYIHIRENDSLHDLNGLNGLINIDGSLSVKDCDSLESLDGLESLESLKAIIIWNNVVLNDISSLSNINSVLEIDEFQILGNDVLSMCSILPLCQYISYNVSNLILGANSTGCNNALEVLDDCMNSPFFNTISGTVTYDSDLNGCDNSDLLIEQNQITTTDGVNSFNTFTNENGEFTLFVLEGDFTTNSLVNNVIFDVTPPVVNTSFTDVGNNEVINYCVSASALLDDVSITLLPLTDSRPGFDTQYLLNYRNQGSTNVSGDVTLIFDPLIMNFLNSNIIPDVIESNSLLWSYTNLNPLESRSIIIDFNIFPPPEVQIDDINILSANITPLSSDINIEDNEFVFEQIIVGSFDPNDKLVLEGDDLYINEINKYLHYIIRFQNTGTASAINIRVSDIIDDKLDLNTFEAVSFSHDVLMIINDNDFQFIFNDINLPDSTNDEPNSHGYIAFKVKPKSNVEIGDVISNNADIFFDYNPSIHTNTVTTTVVEYLLVASPPSDLVICDDDNDGIAEFDLTVTESEIIGGQNPTGLVITFHITQADAINAINQINNSSEYTNISNPQSIYVRLEDSANGEYDTTSFDLIVYNLPVPITPTPLEVCDDNGDGYADFDLTIKDDEIIGGEPDVIVTYHETQADAETGNNPLPNPYTNYVNPQVVYVRVINPDKGCFTIVVLELIVLQSPVIVAVTDLIIFDENNDGIEIFDLTIKILEIIDEQIDVGVYFYETQQDAINDVNMIVNTELYTNITNPQTIFTRLEDLDLCYSVGDFIIFADANLGVIQNLFEDFNIFPNPTHEILNVVSKESIIENILIINLQGIVLKNVSLKNKIDVSDLEMGLFFIQVSIEEKTITKKFIKK